MDVERREYALEVYDENDEFVSRIDVFSTYEEAKKIFGKFRFI